MKLDSFCREIPTTSSRAMIFSKLNFSVWASRHRARTQTGETLTMLASKFPDIDLARILMEGFELLHAGQLDLHGVV